VTDPTPTTPRIVLHTGKGGVGKTTISAATAVAVAHRGRRTLLLSTDPAHSIGDVLGVPIGAEPTAVGTNLWAAQVDTRGRLEQGWSAIRDYLTGLLAARGMAEVQAEELTVLPGAEEIIALLEVHRWAVDGRFDAVLVDCAPSGETLRLLALPETIAFYADRLMGAPRRLLRTLAASLTGGALGGANGQVHDALGDLLDRLTAARTLLTDPARTDIRIVITAERVVIAEARRLLTALYLHGYPVGGVVVNRLLPDEVGGGFLAARREAEASAVQLVNESFAGLPTHHLTLAAREPVGLPALAALGEELYGADDPLGATPAGPGVEVVGDDGRYALRLPLPLVERSSVDLTRSGDELVVTVGTGRRRVALPSLLQRCRVTGARFDGDVLVIGFEPDPARWPEALLDALPDRAPAASPATETTATVGPLDDSMPAGVPR
jgi:arsenite-transporting ATPase